MPGPRRGAGGRGGGRRAGGGGWGGGGGGGSTPLRLRGHAPDVRWLRGAPQIIGRVALVCTKLIFWRAGYDEQENSQREGFGFSISGRWFMVLGDCQVYGQLRRRGRHGGEK